MQPRNATISSVGQQEQIALDINDKIVVIKFGEFDSDIDADDITTIDYSNLVGEMLTVSTLLNRVGLLKAQCEKDLKDARFNHDVLAAETRHRERKQALADGVKATYLEKHVADIVTIDKGIALSQKTIHRLEFELEVLNSLYWSVKSKDDKLQHLSAHVTPQDMEERIIEGVVNQMYVRLHEKHIK